MQRLHLSVNPRALPVLQTAVQVKHAARQRQHHADGGIRDVLGAVVGHVGHRDAAFAGKFVVHIVEADAATDDEFAILQSGNGARSQADEVVEHQRIRILDLSDKIILGHRTERHDLGHVAEQAAFVIKWLFNEIGDNNFRALAHQ